MGRSVRLGLDLRIRILSISGKFLKVSSFSWRARRGTELLSWMIPIVSETFLNAFLASWISWWWPAWIRSK